MIFLIVLAITAPVCIALRKPLHRAPVAFYVIAVILDLLYIYQVFAGSSVLPRVIWTPMYILMQKCTLSLALFFVVMGIGAFPHASFVGRHLRPVRAQLSILAWILSLGHMCVYFASYIPRISAGFANNSLVLTSLGVALLLFILLLVLGITSFEVVKRHMTGSTWASVQRLSYVFFALVFVHLMLMLAPAALKGGSAAQASALVYIALFVAYAGARMVRARIDSGKTERRRSRGNCFFSGDEGR